MAFQCAICKGPCEYDLPRPPRYEPPAQLTPAQLARLRGQRSWWDRYRKVYKRLRVR